MTKVVCVIKIKEYYTVIVNYNMKVLGVYNNIKEAIDVGTKYSKENNIRLSIGGNKFNNYGGDPFIYN